MIGKGEHGVSLERYSIQPEKSSGNGKIKG